MAVRRIVANLAASDPDAARSFYGDFLGLDLGMDMGWIVTFRSAHGTVAQISAMSEGGSGTPVPALSIEVDDVDAVHADAVRRGLEIVYAIADEPWGVRRFYVRDPFGNIINILQHA